MIVSPQESKLTPNDRRFVEIYHLIKAYPSRLGPDVVVVDGFDLILQRGEMVSIIGHSGCGKSTVLSMVAGLNDATSGSIVLSGREISGPGPDRAVVFQAPCLLPWMTAIQNVQLGVDNVYPHGTKQERRDLCEYYLDLVGLHDSMRKYPREMSGGMQQRVGIARALALKPKMLLLDEPFGRLDSLTRMELQDVVLNILDRQQITTLLVTHDVDEALYMSDRVVMMTNGPAAKVGKILELPFARPRDRAAVLDDSAYYEFRGTLVQFLEGQDQARHALATDRHSPERQPEKARLADVELLESTDSPSHIELNSSDQPVPDSQITLVHPHHQHPTHNGKVHA